jgi:hypothetical protein
MSTNISQTRTTLTGFFGRLVRRFRDVRMERAMLEINRHRPGFGSVDRYY